MGDRNARNIMTPESYERVALGFHEPSASIMLTLQYDFALKVVVFQCAEPTLDKLG